MSDLSNEGAGGVSVKGQDDREWTLRFDEYGGVRRWRVTDARSFPGKGVESSVRVVPKAALVGSEARERELEAEREAWRQRYLREESRADIEQNRAVRAEARGAALVEALKELVDAVGVNHGKRSEREHIRKDVKGKRVTSALRQARAALAGVVEAEPAARCACGHPEREGWGHRSHECCRIGLAEPDGSERA